MDNRWHVRLLEAGQDLTSRYSSAVSLHSHTMYSRESLGFIPRHTDHWPVVNRMVAHQKRRYVAKHGHELDFGRGFWTSAVDPAKALQLEAGQIAQLGLHPVVSLSDHDTIEACLQLRAQQPTIDVPISFEWSVTFEGVELHLGIHNLPPADAVALHARLLACSKDSEACGAELKNLHQIPGTLIVFNHPLWDLRRIGDDKHFAALRQFLARHGKALDALELNGLRSWRENAAAAHLAAELHYPLVSGGDRHGMEPNACLNLTSARTFAEFAGEIRREGRSEILMLPQYTETRRVRMFQIAWDTIRDYPELPEGRRHWTGRVFFELKPGKPEPLSNFLNGDGPYLSRASIAVMRFTESPMLRPLLRWLLRDGERAMIRQLHAVRPLDSEVTDAEELHGWSPAA